jgi:transcriptional regulator with XRE-family HTH domain
MTQIYDKSSIGNTLKNRRLEKGLSLDEVNNEIKISIRQLEDIESNNFHKFTTDIQAKGFIRNYAEFLGINYETLWAIYRRDADLVEKARDRFNGVSDKSIKKQNSSRIKLWFNSFRITQKSIYLSSFVLVLLLTSLFVIDTVRSAFKPPLLNINLPVEITGPYSGKLIYNDNSVVIEGKTENNSVLKINGKIIQLNSDHSFKSEEIPTGNSENIITIESENNFNKKTRIVLNLQKSKKVFDNLNLRIVGVGEGTNLKVKIDGVLRFDKKLEPGKIFTYEGISQIEITPEHRKNLLIFLNKDEYSVSRSKLIFEKKENNFFITQE